MSPLGEMRAFIIFNAGVSPPTVLKAWGCTVTENVALSDFTVTPAPEVAQTGLMAPAFIVPDPAAVGGPTLVHANIGTDPGAGFRDVAVKDNGAIGAFVRVVDAAGALAAAAPGQQVVVEFWRTPA